MCVTCVQSMQDFAIGSVRRTSLAADRQLSPQEREGLGFRV